MPSLLSFGIAALLSGAPLVAAGPDSSLASPPRAGDDTVTVAGAEGPWMRLLDGPVRRAVAVRWDVSPERIRIEWRNVPERRPDEGMSGPIRLLGTGSGGHWLVLVSGAGARDGVGADDDALRLRIRAAVMRPTPVAARPLARGDTISAVDVRWDERPVRDPASEASREEPFTRSLDGWVARRRMDEGEPLRPPAVRPPHLVRSGQELRVIWVRSGVRVTLEGTALEHAFAGDDLRVRTSLGEIVRGTAVDPGVVAVESGGTGWDR